MTPVLDRAADVVAHSAPAQLPAALSAIERDTSRRVLVTDADRQVVAASNAALASARLHQVTADGSVTADIGSPHTQSVIEIRGAPVRTVQGADGRALTVVVLPALEEEAEVLGRSGAPLWVWTTIVTGIIAVSLVFAVARRILNPITALTDAAHRMEAGAFDVRVDVRGHDELAELGRAFNGMAARLAETERLRTQMVSDVAHELRSPVTNLRCTLEAIQDGLAAPDRVSIDALHEETLFLQRLIADLRDLTLPEAGQLTLHMAQVDLRDVIRRASSVTSAMAGHAPVRIDGMENLPTIRGDADRLEQVFRNLLSNARTHDPPDGRIDVEARHEGVPFGST
ncbi:MAG: HAMP domain-containing protein [Acidobacteria bacterium]|nr:HAMP domain-containing protein [Acidobacteriota bacterium]